MSEYDIIYRIFELFVKYRRQWAYAESEKTKAANDYERNLWNDIAHSDFDRMRGVENVFGSLGVDFFVLLDAFDVYEKTPYEDTFKLCVDVLVRNLH